MARRDAVLRDHPISWRRACALMGVDPKIGGRDRPPDNPEAASASRHCFGLRSGGGPPSAAEAELGKPL